MNKQNKECIFYIVRHGETEWNKKHILQGQKDSLLTFEGINQAKKIAIMFKKIKFDQIFSSDLIRCRWTAEIIALEHKIIVKTNKLLRELRFGRFEGKKYQEFRDELKEQIELREKLSKNERFCFRLADSVETEEEAMGSFITFLRELALVYPSKKILIVTHGGIVRSFLIHLGFADYEELPPGSIDNTGYVVVGSNGVEFKIIETHGVNKTKTN